MDLDGPGVFASVVSAKQCGATPVSCFHHARTERWHVRFCGHWASGESNQHFALMNLDDAGQIIVLRMNFKKIFVLILGMARMNRDVIIAARTMHRCWKRSQALAALAFGLVNMAMSICGSKQGMIVGYIWADVHIRLGGWLGYRVTWTMVLLCVACVETAHSCANDHGSDATWFIHVHSFVHLWK